jgi:hypothetical protein
MHIVRRRRPSAFAVFAAVALLRATQPVAGALAQSSGGLYQATVITTGSDTRFRSAGFARALREVLVKASGEPRLAADARVGALTADAERLVAFFSYRDEMEGIHHHDDQGTYDRPFDLTVQFDWQGINAALARLGEHPWLGERPMVVPVIEVRGHERPFDQRYMLSDEEPAAAGQRESLSYCAQKYGIGLRVPSAADLAAWGREPALGAAGGKASAEGRLMVVGTLDFRLSTSGWVGAWKAAWHGVDYAWGIGAVSYDKAFDNLFAGVARIASGHGRPDP